MQLGSSLTGSRFVDIAPWPRGMGAGKRMHSFVGSELNFLKLGSDLVDFSEGVSIFS